MPWSLLEILLALPVYVLVLFRLTGLMLTAPLFASQAVPVRIRGALTISIAAMICPLVRSQAPPELTLSRALAGGVGELLIGLSIGLALAIFFLGVEVGGLMVGRQAGLALADVFDPTRDQQSTTIGQVYSITLVMVFLLAGGHRAALAAVLDTFQVIPLLSFRMDDSILLLLAETLTAAFGLGIRLAGPVLIALFLTATAMGVLSRTMPQMNILSVGFTLRVIVALGVAGLAITASQDLLLDATWDAMELIRVAFGLDPGHLRLVN